MSERDELIDCLRYRPVATTAAQMREAADLLERDGARIAELERGEILTDKELVGAIITAVMSSVQSDRNDALRKVQRHIIRVEQERDALETQCEHIADHRALAEGRVAELEAEVKRLIEQRDGPLYRCPQCDHLRLELGEARAALARAEAAERDAERLDFVERHLCRAGDVRDQNGQVTGIMKCWQVVTQCDDSLRDTIDLLRAAIDAAQKEGLA